MTVTQLYALTDYLAKTDSTMFPTAEKLVYFNIAYGLLYGMIIDYQEDNYEAEPTAITTLADTRNYNVAARLHHVNWVKINYGDGKIPARYKSQQDLISEFGNDLENALSQWDKSDPIYWYEGTEINIVPAPSSSQAGAGRLTYSAEALPADLASGSDTPSIPENFHYLLGEYSAGRYHENNGEETQATVRKSNFADGARLMIETMFPRARQAFIQAHVPDDDGSNY